MIYNSLTIVFLEITQRILCFPIQLITTIALLIMLRSEPQTSL